METIFFFNILFDDNFFLYFELDIENFCSHTCSISVICLKKVKTYVMHYKNMTESKWRATDLYIELVGFRWLGYGGFFY